jgi:non-specific serine/threonine protein kinase
VRHAVAWSFGLLSPGEQAMLRHLALLPAGLTFEQVGRELAHVVGEPAYASLRLVQSHLLNWTSDEPRRLVMLETVRELCRDTTRAAGDEAALWQVVRHHALAVADRTEAASLEAWLTLVDAEHDNLRTTLSHLLEDAPELAMRLAGRLAWYWYRRGHYAGGARWLEDSIARSGASGGADLIRALHGAGRLALLGCRYARAEELLERARALAHAAGEVRDEADAIQLLGSVARERGDYERARALHRRGLALWEQLGDPREAGRARNYLVFAAWLGDPHGDPGDEQRAWWHDGGDAELERLGDAEAIVWARLDRGAILHYRGDDAAARELLGRAFAGSVAARFDEGIAWSLDLLGRASLDRGDHLQARAQLTAALRVHRRLGDLWRCASVLEALGAVAIAADHPARGAVYLGAAEAVRRQIDAPVPACERARLEATRALGAALLGDAFAVGRERGRRTSLDQTVALAQEG